MSKILLEGEVINNWVVVQKYGIKNRCMHYIVKCLCGEEMIKNAPQIRKNKQCYKCSRKQQTANGGTRRTHGACSSSSDLFKTYQARHYMIKRCRGKTVKDKKNYVDRGIKVCERWLESFENFLKDMGRKPDGFSLDRIDNDKGYFKENCRWTNIKQQNDNKRGCLYFSHQGETLTIARWAEKLGITRSKAYEWIKREGINWVVDNLDKIKKCKTGMTNEEYLSIGLNIRKGHGQRIHAASRNKDHPLHKMYKSWDYMKHKAPGRCARWTNFLNFVEDMGRKPDGKRLLRCSSEKTFSKKNCYWG